jgi:hypothetical protein
MIFDPAQSERLEPHRLRMPRWLAEILHALDIAQVPFEQFVALRLSARFSSGLSIG